MPYWVVVAKTGGTAVDIEDMGIYIEANSSHTLSDYFDYSDIADSADLYTLVGAGTVTINNGSVDLSAADGVNYIKRDNIYDDLETHYTKTELSTANGGSIVDWSNIVNAPSFGSPVWTEPVTFLITEQAASDPVVSDEGDVYFNTTDDHFYKVVGGAWVDQGSAVTGQRVVDSSDADQGIFTYDGSDLVDGGPPADNAAVMVNDDGDGKNAQYVYSTETSSWIKIADVDFEDHLDGAAGKHDASEIDVEGSYTNIPGSPSDLETVIASIDTQMAEALDNNTLDTAYDQGGNGAGRIITVDSGAVVLDATSTNAPLQIVPKGSLPTTDLLDGQMAMSDGLLFVYDATRGKWLSVQRQYLTFGRRRNTRNQYLNFGVGNMPSNNSGFRMIRNATIVGLSGQLDSNGTCDMQVRRNDTATAISTLGITAANGAVNNIANIDVNANDYLQSYLSAAASVAEPVFIIEIAYRL